MTILLCDVGWGNSGALVRHLKSRGFRVLELNSDINVKDVEAVIIPGVGSMGKAMERLSPFRTLIQELVNTGKPTLGICLGMQLLTKGGWEGSIKFCPALNIINGTTVKLPASYDYPLPHIGWNDIKVVRASRLLSGLPNQFAQYFSNSYFVDIDSSSVLGFTSYSCDFPAVVQEGNIFGVQFHPEKSGMLGKAIVNNFLDYVIAK